MITRRRFLQSAVCSTVLLASPSLMGSLCRAGQVLRVMATSYPVMLLLHGVTDGVDGIETSLLVQAQAGCPHDYALTPRDLMALSKADVLVANGGGFEPFLGNISGKFPKLGILEAGAGLKPLEAKHEEQDGLEGDHQEKGEHGHSHEGGHGHSHEGGNAHWFSSPAEAARMVRNMGEGLAKAAPWAADALLGNAAKAATVLEALAEDVRRLGEISQGSRFILQHDAMEWFFHDAGIPVEAVLQPGEDEAPTASLLAELVARMRAERARWILVSEPQLSDRPVQTLARETAASIVMLDSLAKGGDDGFAAYLSAMKGNVERLQTLLMAR